MKKLINYLEKIMDFYAAYFNCTNYHLPLLRISSRSFSRWHVLHSFWT